MPAPPPESEPAMISTRPLIGGPAKARTGTFAGRAVRSLFGGLGRHFGAVAAARGRHDLGADRVDDAGKHIFVLALRHDPDHRLGPRLADHQPSRRTEAGLALGDRLPHAARFERLPLAEAHIA